MAKYTRKQLEKLSDEKLISLSTSDNRITVDDFGTIIPNSDFYLSWSSGNDTPTGTYITLFSGGTFVSQNGSTGQYCINGVGDSTTCSAAGNYSFYLSYDSGTWFKGQLEKTMPAADEWSTFIASGNMDLTPDNDFHLYWTLEGVQLSTYIELSPIEGTFTTTGRRLECQEENLSICSSGQYCINGEGGTTACALSGTSTFYLLYDNPYEGSSDNTVVRGDGGYDASGDWEYSGTYHKWDGTNGTFFTDGTDQYPVGGTFTTGKLNTIPIIFTEPCISPLCREGRFSTEGGSNGNWRIDFTCTYSTCSGTNDTFIYVYYDSGTALVGELFYDTQYKDWLDGFQGHSGYENHYHFSGESDGPGDIYKHDGSVGQFVIGTDLVYDTYHNMIAGPANLAENNYGWKNGFQQREGCHKYVTSFCEEEICWWDFTIGYNGSGVGSNTQTWDQASDHFGCSQEVWDNTSRSSSDCIYVTMNGLDLIGRCDCTCGNGAHHNDAPDWADCMGPGDDEGTCVNQCKQWCRDGYNIEEDSSSSTGEPEGTSGLHYEFENCYRGRENFDSGLTPDIGPNYYYCKYWEINMENLGNDFLTLPNQFNIWYKYTSGDSQTNCDDQCPVEDLCATENVSGCCYGAPGYCQMEITLTSTPVWWPDNDPGSTPTIDTFYEGQNLVSFPFSDLDSYAISDIFQPIDNYFGIVGEGTAASATATGWVGSLTTIDPKSGYWVGVNEDTQSPFCCTWDNSNVLDSSHIDSNTVYNLNAGSNLISFPGTQPMDVSVALAGYEDDIDGVIGNGIACANFGGYFAGSLTEFEPNHGYWIKTSADVDLVYGSGDYVPLDDDDDTTTTGCTATAACNYSASATEDDGSCEYDSDCFGTCGGNAVVDDCGVCGGNDACLGECGTSDCNGYIETYSQYAYDWCVDVCTGQNNSGHNCVYPMADWCDIAYGYDTVSGELCLYYCRVYGPGYETNWGCEQQCENLMAINVTWGNECVAACEAAAPRISHNRDSTSTTDFTYVSNKDVPLYLTKGQPDENLSEKFNDYKERLQNWLEGNNDIGPRPLGPRPLPSQDCRQERQLLQKVSQLSSLEEMVSELEGYLRNNEPCLNVTSTRDDTLCGDVNGDGLINVLDIVQIVNFILGNLEFNDHQICAADMDSSDGLNILDIVQIMGLLLNPPTDPLTCNHCDDSSPPLSNDEVIARIYCYQNGDQCDPTVDNFWPFISSDEPLISLVVQTGAVIEENSGNLPEGIDVNKVVITAPHAQGQYRPTRWYNSGDPSSGSDYCDGYSADTQNECSNGEDCYKASDFCTGAMAKVIGEITGATVIYTRGRQSDPNYYDYLGIDYWGHYAGDNVGSGNAIDNMNLGGIQTPAYEPQFSSQGINELTEFKSTLGDYLSTHPEIKLVLDFHGAGTTYNHWDVDIGLLGYNDNGSNGLTCNPGQDGCDNVLDSVVIGPTQEAFNNDSSYPPSVAGTCLDSNFLEHMVNIYHDNEIGWCNHGCDGGLSNCPTFGDCPPDVTGHGPISFNDFAGSSQHSVTRFVNKFFGSYGVDSVQIETSAIYRCLSTSNPNNVLKYTRAMQQIVDLAQGFYTNNTQQRNSGTDSNIRHSSRNNQQSEKQILIGRIMENQINGK
jgi:hypothetical protein